MDEERIGVALGDSLIVDVHEATAGLRLPFNFPYTMRELIDFDSVAQETIRFLLYQSERYPHRVKPIPLTEIEWLPPVRRPGKIICVDVDRSRLGEPLFWLKPTSSLIGHNQTIKVNTTSSPIFPAPRLSVVIGKQVHKVSAANALESVYGYTILNDIAGQWDTHSLVRGSDTFGPMGPWLVTKNEVHDPNMLDITLKLGAKTHVITNTCAFSHTVEAIIETISAFQTLDPGDVIAFGTKQKEAKLIDLQTAAGLCEISIDGIGILQNPTIILAHR